MKDILVSIVVPVYNVEKYVGECIDSLICQNYKKLEIILVDDGSSDKSGEICDCYAKKDDRIIVIHKDNGGLSSSREAGISIATGDYIMLVDGDDWIDSVTVGRCVEKAEEKENVDCVLFSYIKEYPGSSVPMHIMDGYTELTQEQAEDRVYRRLFGLSNEELCHPERMENVVSCCMKLYRASVAKKGRYFDNRVVGSSEDALFNMYALHNCRNVTYIDECYYHYRKTGNSLSSIYRADLDKKWGLLFRIMQDIIDEKNLPEKYSIALTNRIALSITAIGLNGLSDSESGDFTKYKRIREYLCSENYQNACKKMRIGRMPFVWKVFFVCCKLKFALSVFIMLKSMKWLKRYR